MSADDEATPYWRQCELAWAASLTASNYLVTRLMDNLGNAPGTVAPLLQFQGEALRAPDLESKVAGKSEYWEVKFRSRPDVNPLTGQVEYWMSYESARHYHRVRELSGSEVWVVLFDASAAGVGTRWLKASIVTLFDVGRREDRAGSGGQSVEAWVWPATCMDVVTGPPVALDLARAPVLPEEGDQPPVPLSTLAPVERALRRSPKAPTLDAGVPAGVYDVLRHDAQVGLDVLRQQLGIATYPRYSVLRIGLDGLDLGEVLDLTRYGIRVFLVTSTRPPTEVDEEWLAALMEARLLEWSVVSDLGGVEGWWVDGRGMADAEAEVQRVLEAADEGDLNLGQYRIVHAPHADDVLVMAGAGTGKTETMAERLVFLLATNVLRSDTDEARHLFDLRVDEIALVTFTREAASEMRQRIARTLMLRQRLCDRCVLPATSWLMQLSATDIDTIHSYARKLIQRAGASVGLSPGFGVSPQTMEFRRLVQLALSEPLAALYSEYPVKSVPPEFEFVRFIEDLWGRLASNGLSPLELVEGVQGRSADWGDAPDGINGAIASVCRQVIDDVAQRFRSTCLDAQKLQVSELVPTATAVLSAAGAGLPRAPRYVFVDEFQDTDAEQMDMVLALRSEVGGRLFVVGDEKQGIYRFRGAQGSAFSELKERVTDSKPFTEFDLTKNFRSGSNLLDSLHPWFAEWGDRGFLEYKPDDRLVAGSTGPDRSSAMTRTTARTPSERKQITVQRVQDWITASPESTIAVLCRRNAEAIEYQKALRDSGVSCELRVGGDFYQTRAVVEVRVLLEAVLDPDDDAALLELCETRWFGGLASAQELGAPSLPAMMSWRDRLASSRGSGSFGRSDLDAMRDRVRGLARLLQMQPTLAWLVECAATLQPTRYRLPSEVDHEVELRRYKRCLDHLIAKLDEAFADAPISPHLVLSWLRLQVATNSSEDEPPPESDSPASVTAITVHKAKGLEFDYVIMPKLSTQFGASRSHDEIAIVGTPDGSARLLWKWKRGNEGVLTNVGTSDPLWAAEASEVIREETRLLYVAMTRAKTELVMLTPGSGAGSNLASAPSKWADLVLGVGGHGG